MKPRFLFLLLLVAAAAAAGGYFFARSRSASESPSAEKKVAFYQSAMHPWIKSDKPGACTICGMKLTPIYEGEEGFAGEGNLVTLNSNSIDVINVQSEPAQRRSLEHRLRVAGRIEADPTKYRLISAYVDGRIDQLHVNFVGAEVREGEPLAKLYSPVLQTAQREYLNLLAQTNLASSPQLQAEHERMLKFAATRLQRLGLSKEQIQTLNQNADELFHTEITAPISGTVIKREVYEGQYVKEGDRLFEIADLSTMWFRFDVYEQDLPWLSLGQMVEVTSPALAGQTISGPVVFIEPTLNQETRSVKVRVELENPIIESASGSRFALFNGLYAEGAILHRSDSVLAVPASAVLHPGDYPRVYLDHGGGAYEPKAVRLGRKGGSWWEILDGLEEGDRVVTSGNLLIDSQAQIHRVGVAHSHGSPDEHTSNTDRKHTAAPQPVPFTEDQSLRMNEFIQAASALAQALAADDLNAYNSALQTGQLTQNAEALHQAFPDIQNVALVHSTASALKPAPDLDTARLAFLPFSMAAVDLVRAVDPQLNQIQGRVFKCPMYPARGKTAFWLQREPPLRNPFYGSEMLECGEELNSL